MTAQSVSGPVTGLNSRSLVKAMLVFLMGHVALMLIVALVYAQS
jgi:hypothetical protein